MHLVWAYLGMLLYLPPSTHNTKCSTFSALYSKFTMLIIYKKCAALKEDMHNNERWEYTQH